MNASNLIRHQARTACALAFCLLPSLAQAVSVTPDELALSRRWAAARFETVATPAAGPAAPAASEPRLFAPARPFSFTFDGNVARFLENRLTSKLFSNGERKFPPPVTSLFRIFTPAGCSGQRVEDYHRFGRVGKKRYARHTD